MAAVGLLSQRDQDCIGRLLSARSGHSKASTKVGGIQLPCPPMAQPLIAGQGRAHAIAQQLKKISSGA